MLDYRRCTLCPRACGVDRTAGERGFCQMPDHIHAARAALHYWEEPVISGSFGSGAVFFSGCTLRCAFCQNGVISDEQMTRGVIIRHLVLPGCIDNSLGVLDWIADHFPKKDVLVSLMSQYVPMGRAKQLPPLDRRITQEEYDAVLSYLYLLELDNGYTQDFSAASADYIPDFDLEGL